MSEVRIEIGNNEYAYCGVSDNAHEWADIYSSGLECYLALRQEIFEDCKERGYDEITIEKVLMYYKIRFGNYAGKWVTK